MGPCAPALTAMQPAMPMLPQAPLQLAAPFAAFSSNAPDVRQKKKRTTSSSSSTSSSTSTKELRRKLHRKEKKSRKHSSPAPPHKHHRKPASRKRRVRASTPRGRSHSHVLMAARSQVRFLHRSPSAEPVVGSNVRRHRARDTAIHHSKPQAARGQVRFPHRRPGHHAPAMDDTRPRISPGLAWTVAHRFAVQIMIYCFSLQCLARHCVASDCYTFSLLFCRAELAQLT